MSFPERISSLKLMFPRDLTATHVEDSVDNVSPTGLCSHFQRELQAGEVR